MIRILSYYSVRSSSFAIDSLYIISIEKLWYNYTQMANLVQNHNRLVVGLTGGIASGKSTVGEALAKLKVQRINVDSITHQVLAPDGRAYREVAQQWPQFVDEEQKIVRSALRAHVFKNGNEKERRLLEAITRPSIKTEISMRLQQPEGYYTVLESALLFETGADERVDTTVVVDTDEALQAERAVMRDGEDCRVEEIMAKQLARLDRLQRADHVIPNRGTKQELLIATHALHYGWLLPMALAKSAPTRHAPNNA